MVRTWVGLSAPVDLQEMLRALRDVGRRAYLFRHHASRPGALSVRQRMGELLSRLVSGQFHDFTSLFTPEEGRLGVVVTFLALLELAKEQLIEVLQDSELGPTYVKTLAATDNGGNHTS